MTRDPFPRVDDSSELGAGDGERASSMRRMDQATFQSRVYWFDV